MGEQVVGLSALERRLTAVASPEAGLRQMRLVAAVVRGQVVLNMPRRTGTTARSVQPRGVTAAHAQLWGSPVARYLEEGTGLYGPRHREITPVAKRALAFTSASGVLAAGGRVRLSGAPTAATARRMPGAGKVVVRSVRGMRARPYIARSVAEASAKVGQEITAVVVSDWNGAA